MPVAAGPPQSTAKNASCYKPQFQHSLFHAKSVKTAKMGLKRDPFGDPNLQNSHENDILKATQKKLRKACGNDVQMKAQHP